MDVLGDILATLRLRSRLFFRAEFTAPFAIAVPAERNVIRFHLVSEGACRVTMDGGEEVLAQTGDLLFVPRGAAHVLSSVEPASTPVPLARLLEQVGHDGGTRLVYGGGGSTAVLVCGYFSFDQEVPHPLVATLPTLARLEGRTERRHAWLESLFDVVNGESCAREQAWEEIITRVAEILFIYTLRDYMRVHPQAPGAIVALSDHRIARALKAVHAEPAFDWTLDALAARAALSRSAFTGLFRAALGMSPMQYVAVWRMHKARALLDRPGCSIQQIALEVGYESESAFNRAFRRYFGVPPGRMRRASGPD